MSGLYLWSELVVVVCVMAAHTYLRMTGTVASMKYLQKMMSSICLQVCVPK